MTLGASEPGWSRSARNPLTFNSSGRLSVVPKNAPLVGLTPALPLRSHTFVTRIGGKAANGTVPVKFAAGTEVKSAGEMAPVRLAASSAVTALPSPEKEFAVTVPEKLALDG